MTGFAIDVKGLTKRFGSKVAALGWAGWQLMKVVQDFRGK